MRYAVMNTPLGELTLVSTEDGLEAIHFGSHVPSGATLDSRAHRVFIQQIEEYFQGARTKFDFPMHFDGTSFQVAVWHELLNIPYGHTRTYGEIAKRMGKPGAARAVGM